METTRGSNASRTRGILALITVVVLAPALALMLGGSAHSEPLREEAPASTPTTSVPSQLAAPADYCLERFLEPLAAIAASDVAAASPDWQARLANTLTNVRRVFPGPITTLVATIADPIDSGMGYQFDTSLAALRLAIESPVLAAKQRYFRDRAFLPWDDRSAPEGKNKESEACRYTLPGLVLFRGSDAKDPKLFALLLVGETPTSGVHAKALLRAAEIAKAFDPELGAAATPFSIVGPTFSGSAHSLRLGVSQFIGVEQVRIVTGSATGAALKSVLESPGIGPKVQFAATTAPEAAARCSYLRFLHYFLGFHRGDLRQTHASGSPRPLEGVALLHESGTEFGTRQSTTSTDCTLVPAVDISFPVHVSRLRDAYEAMDLSRQNGGDRDLVARRTALAVSLREKNSPLSLGAEPSPKTTFAQDIALSNVLAAISREGVRHVAIQATDVGDAIFLARKIRDVAPDVRLAFFAADTLMLHPAFRRDLGGSLVITPYPFLGSTDFAQFGAEPSHSHIGFENSASEGIFNAALVARGARINELRDYRFTEVQPLSMWISAIGPSGLVPITLSVTNDPNATIFPNKPRAAQANSSEPKDWQKLARAELRLAESPHLPRLWQFLYALLLLVFVIDQIVQKRTLDTFSSLPIPGRMGRREDRQADLAIVRTKWSLYAAIRTFVLAFGIGYMTLLYALPLTLRRGFGDRAVLALLGFLALAAVYRAALKAWIFGSDYLALGRCVNGFSPLTWLSLRMRRARESKPPPMSVRASPLSDEQSQDSALEGEKPPRPWGWDRWSAPLGFAGPEGRIPAALTSFAQLRLLANLALVVALAFSAGEVVEFTGRAVTFFEEGHPVQSTILLALRSLPLLNTISPAAPTLLCVATIYVWCVGRMARIRLAHGISRISPDDGVADVATTPIRVILYPHHGEGQRADESFTRVERRTINAILRPITGPNYFFALVVIIFIPVVLFTLKPPSTLERPLSTSLLVAGLGLCTVLVGNTLLQLLQHWFALELMLKRILQHPLGRSFDHVARFVRDTTSQQVSRVPHDLLRLGGCAVRFDELVRSGKRLDASGFASDRRKKLEAHALTVHSMRSIALTAATHTDLREAANHEANLGREIITAASEVMRLLCEAWEGRITRSLPAFRAAAVNHDDDDSDPPAPPDSEIDRPIDSTDDALSAESYRYTKLERAWLREAEAFVATVVALLINRHVRQFQYFLYALTSTALLLLLAIVSYPFQPQRLLLTWIWIVVGSVVLAGLFVYIELDRNALLSRIAGTTPGHLTLNGTFALRVLAWGIVPLLGVAAAQYPDLANTLFHWLEPFTRALR
ncbi:MAG: hypothetical protein ACOY0T_39605 [Myxococcota bacterium]